MSQLHLYFLSVLTTVHLYLCVYVTMTIIIVICSFLDYNHCNISFSTAINCDGREVYLRDIWPTREEIQAVEKAFVVPSMFREVYEKIEVNCALDNFCFSFY